ncbi:3-oxoadipate enol-lactonase [Novosphingobium sp. SG720]|uniref:3-oxoadipate enol-lactonase n=1 Tax=Novosphingobium sp. SG720 TaxID=2586998 RepID=UPI00144667D8|nr:3-oxoadipate enol-lactonase [Novosphingobium sp. SG720]NKJ42357.1 3-oxoadipate enol-lactonase [Novosphingobium sp. SG720]
MSPHHLTLGDGCRLAWTSDGDPAAPPLILSNSLGTDRAMWTPQLAPLAQHFHVIRYDTRGHGASDAWPGGYGLDRLGRDVLELADALGLARFAFCGLSLGGMTGQWLGVHAPERLTRLVIANSAPYMGPPSAWDARIATVRSQGMAAIADAVVERWFTPAFRADPDNTAAILATLHVTDPQGYAGCCAAIRDMDLRPLLSLIETPTLVIGGAQDPATPPEQTRALIEGIAGATGVILDAAHLSNLEQPAAFTAALLDHLNKTSGE